MNVKRKGRDDRRPTRSSDLTGSALVALRFLSSSDRLALSLLRNRAQAEAALGKSTPWSSLARNARTEEAWSADEERKKKRWQDQGLGDEACGQRKHGELTAFWGTRNCEAKRPRRH
ncbi:hypothetical protein HDV63DRAFT_403494 [Trichoderma sp. SZMC 28014]